MMKQLLISTVLVLSMGLLAACSAGPVIQIDTPAPDKPAATPGPGIQFPAASINVAAPGPNPEMNKPDAHGQIASILLGIWHGLISPITLVLSFVYPGTQMYEVHNDGSPYNLGFLLGIILVWAIVGAGIGGRRR